MKNTKACDMAVGLGFVILGVAVILYAGQLQSVRRGIGPGGYPTVIAALMILLGVVQVGRSLVGGWPAFSFDFEQKPALKVAAVVVLSFVYTFLVKSLGFLLLTPILLFALMYIFGYRKYARAAVASVCVSTCTWVVFARIFMIFLPEFSLF